MGTKISSRVNKIIFMGFKNFTHSNFIFILYRKIHGFKKILSYNKYFHVTQKIVTGSK
jgi:hypothetical protein